MFGEFSASLEYQIYYFVVAGGYLPDSALTNVLCLAIVHSLIFLVGIFMWSAKLWENGILTVHWRELLTAIYIGAFAYVLSNISYVLTDTPFSASLSSELFIIRTLTDFGGVAVLLVYDRQLRERMLNTEQAMLRSMLRMQHNTYQNSKASMDLVNRKYHDLKHQIALLRAQDGDIDRKKYLDQLEQEISIFESVHRTGNDVLDSMLNAKALRCHAQNIEMVVIAQGEILNFMDAMDLCNLFGNALDNAIEAVELVPDMSRRMIRVVVSQQRNFVRILIENQHVNEVTFDNGVPRSNKGNQDNHGYGFKSIRDIVHRYEGTVRAQTQDGWFSLSILMPLSKV
ncbi:GHKL domain-containing protein [Alloscardovia omnicolens]|uniref:sensor histidine kinase n=1 Tax=Alloscardovia omnicolens TaxID=419015 RepID=UPI003A780ADB